MPPRVTSDVFDAVLLDMDGVLTSTARLHAACWKQTFDAFLSGWDADHGSTTAPFSTSDDYAAWVDGKPREDGVRDFLWTRGIVLPEGLPDAPAGEASVWGLGNWKQALVEEALRSEGVDAFPGSVAWLRELRSHGLRTAVVTASRNGEEVLSAAGIADLLDVRVDGKVTEQLGLRGKPAPDTFLEAARRLGVPPTRAVVVEDARAGVQAGRAGGFGLVIGVDRVGQAEALLAAGADVVVHDLGELVTSAADVSHPAGPKLHRLQAATERLLAAEGDFPIEPDRIVERRFNLDHVPQLETIFALSNGFLGIRGVHEEANPAYDAGALLNGFYESWPIIYPERAYGFAETGQTIVPVPDGSVVRLLVDGEQFHVHKAELLEYERVLDMAAGVLERWVVWREYDGSRFSLRSQRMVSLDFRHLACVEYELTALDRPARFTISSELLTHRSKVEAGFDPRRASPLGPEVLGPLVRQEREERLVLGLQTRSSGMRMACGAHHELTADGPWEVGIDFPEDSSARVVFRVNGEVGRPLRLVKYLAYHHERNESATELCFRVNETLDRAHNAGIERLRQVQRRHLDAFWRDTDVHTEGAPLLQQAIRFNLFQLLQASAGVAGYGIPAKGLTGQGYEGHYFWDTEIYVMPFLTYTAPNAARSLVRHRYDMLNHARERARQVGNRGALFPWRTISGDEASAYYAAGTAQYHIDADVAYALTQYVNATHDYEAMARFGLRS